MSLFTCFVASLWAGLRPEMRGLSRKKRTLLFGIRFVQFFVLQILLVPVIWATFAYAMCSAYPTQW